MEPNSTGWGFTDRPALTVSNSVGRGLAGGSGARSQIVSSLAAGKFIPSPHGDGSGLSECSKITPEEASILQSYPAGGYAPHLRNLEMDEEIIALDLFAGTGWGVACKRLGIEERGVELMAEAVATRTANGMETVYNDVWQGILLSREMHEILYGAYTLLIGSPPCQTFSIAGKGAGLAALHEVLEAIRLHAYKDPQALLEFGEKHDMRTALVLTPLAYVYRDRPKYVALEQVPTVLPVWEACAEIMREMGYSVKTAVLQAEQYGVPQTRKRAILVARLDGEEVQLPAPTHSRYYPASPTKLDPDVQKWVSMAEALGWADADPAQRLFCPTNLRPHAGIRTGDTPATTLAFGHDNPRWLTPAELEDYRATGAPQPGVKLVQEELAALQTYPTGRGLVDRPSPTITGGGTETGGAEPIAKYHARYTSAPGWHGPTDRLSTEEAGTLQTYEPPFVWCGTKSKVFLQIGNAVPPLLAQHVLEALVEPSLI